MSIIKIPPSGGGGGGGSGFANPATTNLDMGSYDIVFEGGNSQWDVFPSGGDDTVAIQAAITAASTAGGGIVQLYQGTYTISDAITWPNTANYVILQGKGQSTIINAEIPLENPPANPWAFDLLGAGINSYACNNTTIGGTSVTTTTAGNAANFQAGDVVRLEGLDPDGVANYQENKVVTATAGTGVITLLYKLDETMTSVQIRNYRNGHYNGIKSLSIYHPGASNGAHTIGVRYQYRAFLKDLYTNGAVGSGGDGISLLTSIGTLVEDCVFDNYDVIELYPTVSDVVAPNGLHLQANLGLILNRVKVQNSGLSTQAQGASIIVGSPHVDCKFIDVTIEDSQKTGINFGSTTVLNRCDFSRVNIINSGNFGVYGSNAFYMKKTRFHQIRIDGTNSASGGAYPGFILINPTYSKGCSFTEIFTDNCAGEGMNLQNIKNFTMTACAAGTNVSAGILFYQCDNGTISGCSVNDTTNHGLYIWACTDLSINGGSFCSNGGKGIESLAGSSNITIVGVVAKNNTGNNLEMDATDSSFTIVGNDFGGTKAVYNTGSGHIITSNRDT